MLSSTALAVLLLSTQTLALPPALVRRDDCQPEPSGAGPVPTPDTASAFVKGPVPSNAANGIATPSGYVQAFAGQNAAVSGNGYQGYAILNAFDPAQCAATCTGNSNCAGFNIFMERAPSVDPDPTDCPNPPSYTYYKCSFWSGAVSQSQATNAGQYRASFQVVVVGSYGFNKQSTQPTTVNGQNGPWQYSLTGNTQLSYSPGTLGFSLSGTSPAPSAWAYASFVSLDSSYTYLFSATYGRNAGASGCTLYFNGATQPDPGNGGGNIWVYIYGRTANVTVSCPNGANSGTYNLNSVALYRVKNGGSSPQYYETV